MGDYQRLPTDIGQPNSFLSGGFASRAWKYIAGITFASVLVVLGLIHFVTNAHSPSYPSTELACLQRGRLRDNGDLFAFPSSEDLTGKFEPSGAVWDEEHQWLWVVSDNSKVAAFDKEGNVVRHWKIRPKWDFEGAAKIDNEYVSFQCFRRRALANFELVFFLQCSSRFLFLAVEYPTTVLKFDTHTGEVVEQYPLNIPGPGNDDPNRGVESIAYLASKYQPSLTRIVGSEVPASDSGYFLIGLQATGDVFIYPNPPMSDPLSRFKWPPPTKAWEGHVDLAELTVFNGHLYASLDRHKTLSRVELVLDARGDKAQVKPEWQYFKDPKRGIEALSFARSKSGDSEETYLFVGYDYKKRRGIYRYTC